MRANCVRSLIQAMALLIGCGLSLSAPAAQAQTIFKVGNIKLGDNAKHNPLYKKHKCAPSEKFPSFTWCQLNSDENGVNGPYAQTRSMLHSTDGRVHYVSKFIAPAFFKANEIEEELARLGNVYGGSPIVVRMPEVAGMTKGVIAIWGSIHIEPVDNNTREKLKSGIAFERGFLIDHLGDFQKSLQSGAPIYFLRGGPGLVWDASHDHQGRGVLRITAFDDRSLPSIPVPLRSTNTDVAQPSGPSQNGEARRPDSSAAAPISPAPTRTPTTAINRIALVIGNGEYNNLPKLKNPKHDAEDITQALREIGFHVFFGEDLSKDAMSALIKEFSFQLGGAEVALVYYAGHGVQKDGKNYLLPITAKIDSEESLDAHGLQLASIEKQLQLDNKHRVNIMVLDACRDNPIPGLLQKNAVSRSVSARSGLAREDVGLDTLIVFSTAPDAVALDGEGRNSPFAEALLRHIKTHNLDIEMMLRRVSRDVQKITDGQQIPWRNSNLSAGIDLVNSDNSAPSITARPDEPLPPVNVARDNAPTAIVVGAPSIKPDDLHSQEKCDELAANPHDGRKPKNVIGVTYEGLRFHAEEAVVACGTAVERASGDVRYLYQEARAMQVNRPAEAIQLLNRVLKEGYPAAFDNYGWIMMDRRINRDDVAAATASFRKGVELGDSSSMVSLASLIIKGHAAPQFRNEHVVLLERAASLGHYEALEVLQKMGSQLEPSNFQTQQNQEAQRMFMGIVGGMIGSAIRR